MHISVIIPTYKPQDYLWQCLNSLENQTLDKQLWELIIVLNGCSEPWRDAIESYLQTHQLPNARLIQTDIAGVSNARNMGLDTANGEYIAFIDDDDYVSETYLEELYKIADIETVSLSYAYAFEDGKEKIQLPYANTRYYETHASNERQKADNIRKYFSGSCMKLIHTSIIGNRRFDTKLANGEDSLFMFLISDKIKWAAFTSPNAIYYRRQRIGSAYTKSKSTLYILRNFNHTIWTSCKVYFSHIYSYSLRRYLLFTMGSIHALIDNLKHK